MEESLNVNKATGGPSALSDGLEVSEIRKALDPVTKALLNGLITDGAHHKQWALEQALRALCTDEYVDKAKTEFQWKDGIAP